MLCLRVPREFVKALDSIVRGTKVSRGRWIREAIMERARKEPSGKMAGIDALIPSDRLWMSKEERDQHAVDAVKARRKVKSAARRAK